MMVMRAATIVIMMMVHVSEVVEERAFSEGPRQVFHRGFGVFGHSRRDFAMRVYRGVEGIDLRERRGGGVEGEN